jgi:uncharacterized protein (TIGR02145 family)
MGLLVYDGRTVSKQKGDVATFAYAPQLCKLIIVVKPEDGYEDVDLTDAPNLTVRGLPTKALYNLHLSTMEIPTDKTDAGTETDVTLTPVVTNKDSVRWEALILPHAPSHAADAGRFFTFTLGGSPYEYELENETFVKGTKYRYDFTLSEPKITPQTTVVDGMTNCYMVAPGESVTFPVSRAYTYNALDETFENTLRANVGSGDYPHLFTTEVLWDDNGVISGIPTVSGTGNTAELTVQTTSNHGNAVVAIKVDATIVWSYHIWVTDYMDRGRGKSVSMVNGHIFMDRNLGATAEGLTSTAYGLLYQWGRKDPFPGGVSGSAGWNAKDSFSGLGSAAATTKTTNAEAIIDAIQNPMTFFRLYSFVDQDWLPAGGDDTLWRSTDYKKTIYDPCPMGWRVPDYVTYTPSLANSPWLEYDDFECATYGTTSMWGTPSGGWKHTRGDVDAYYPASGHNNNIDGEQASATMFGYYWMASTTYESANAMYFHETRQLQLINTMRSYGFAVRCVRE